VRFLFDEPLSNLDAKLRVQMRLEIKQLQSRLGVTSLYVTHDQVEAMTMADRMIVMNAGVAEQFGTPLDVYEQPRTLFAAQFIGSPSMNVLDGVVSDGVITLNNGVTLHCNSQQNGPVKVGIRPEHLVDDPNGPLEFKVGLSEPLGATTIMHGTFSNSQEAITVSLPGVFKGEQGASRKLSVALEHVHLFDIEQGLRIN